MRITFTHNDDKIRFQLQDLSDMRMLFDFIIANEDYYAVVNHIDDAFKIFEKQYEKRLRLKKK